MKKIKIFITIAILGLSISCKKNDTTKEALKSTEKLSPVLDAKATNIIINNYFGECITNTADSIANWVHTYGAGGEKENDAAGAWDAMGEISSDRYECKTGSKPGQKSYPIFYAPPVYETEGINNLQELLMSLGIIDMCNSSQVAFAKLKLNPINIIINRAINGLSGTAYYYGLNNSEKLYEILTNFNSNESYLLEDDGFTLLYLMMVANRDFPIPENIAINLFGKSSLYQSPNGANAQYYDWDGFIIDGYDINTYCASFIQLPSPLPSIIYYTSNYPNDTNSSINQATSIYHVDGSYVTTNSPLYAYVPNGYYKHPNDFNNHTYYHIVNGMITEIVQAITDSSGPVLTP